MDVVNPIVFHIHWYQIMRKGHNQLQKLIIRVSQIGWCTSFFLREIFELSHFSLKGEVRPCLPICKRRVLIKADRKFEPKIYRRTSCNRLMEILPLTNSNVLEYGWHHLDVRRILRRFRMTSAPSPSRPSSEHMKRGNCILWTNQSSLVLPPF